MARYSLRFKASVAKDLRRLPKKDVSRILKRIEDRPEALIPVAHGAKRSAASLKQLLIEELPRDIYRVRQDRYRILYEIHDSELVILVIRVAHRRDAYR